MTFSTPQVTGQGNNLHVRHGDDSSLYVEFYMESIPDDEATEKEGRPIFRDVPFIKIIPVGDTKTVINRPIKLHADASSPADTERWPNKYQAFLNQQVQVNEGTPLEEWSLVTKSQTKSMKAINIHTVEQLAAVTDTNLQNVGMGAMELRDKAAKWLEGAKGNAKFSKLEKEKEDLKTQLEAIKNEFSAFKAEMSKKEKNG